MARDALARQGSGPRRSRDVEAAGVFSQAAELADDPLEEARLRERAGLSAHSGGDMEGARRELERSNELYAAAGATREAALVEARLANAEWQLHQAAQGLERLQAAYAVLVQGEADEGFAAVSGGARPRTVLHGRPRQRASARSTPRSRQPSGSGCRRRSPRG